MDNKWRVYKVMTGTYVCPDCIGRGVAAVNRAFSPMELERIRTCVKRNRPYGSAIWQKQTATRLGLMASLRPEGRPRKNKSA